MYASTATNPALSIFISEMQRKWGRKIEKAFLFGSVARGEQTPSSDIDLLVIVKEDDIHLRHALIGLAYDIFLKTGEDISVKVMGKNDFERTRHFSFLSQVMKDGVQVA